MLKGSIQIASAVNHCLQNLNTTGIKTVRLVADGCGGQNKNSIMVGMCSFWLEVQAPRNIENVEIIFPIPGHSYMPPDRVFGQIEKVVKNIETLTDPMDYINIFQRFGTVIELGSDECPVKDWKAEAINILKPPGTWHFKFKEARRFIISKSGTRKVRGEVAYTSDCGNAASVIKRGKSIRQFNPEPLNAGTRVSEAKLNDVQNLLTIHFGDGWEDLPDLKYYIDVIHADPIHIPYDDTTNDPICEYMEQSDNLSI